MRLCIRRPTRKLMKVHTPYITISHIHVTSVRLSSLFTSPQLIKRPTKNDRLLCYWYLIRPTLSVADIILVRQLKTTLYSTSKLVDWTNVKASLLPLSWLRILETARFYKASVRSRIKRGLYLPRGPIFCDIGLTVRIVTPRGERYCTVQAYLRGCAVCNSCENLLPLPIYLWRGIKQQITEVIAIQYTQRTGYIEKKELTQFRRQVMILQLGYTSSVSSFKSLTKAWLPVRQRQIESHSGARGNILAGLLWEENFWFFKLGILVCFIFFWATARGSQTSRGPR